MSSAPRCGTPDWIRVPKVRENRATNDFDFHHTPGKVTQELESIDIQALADRIPDSIRVQHIVGEGTIYKTIIETADQIGADLIIMGSHRPELQDYLLGPNAARVVRHSAKSVLVVR